MNRLIYKNAYKERLTEQKQTVNNPFLFCPCVSDVLYVFFFISIQFTVQEQWTEQANEKYQMNYRNWTISRLKT